MQKKGIMKRLSFMIVLTAVLLSLGSCNRQDRKLLRYSMSDTSYRIENATLMDFVWKDGAIQQVNFNNPYLFDRPDYEDYSSVFNYNLEYAYSDSVLCALKGNKYYSKLNFVQRKLESIDQYSQDGVHAYHVTFTPEDSYTMKVVYYSMSNEAMKWLESNLYPRKDSAGAKVHYEMPEDTSLHVFAEATYQWKDGNLVYAKASFVEGFSVESNMEYDNKVNPFHNIYCKFDRVDFLASALHWADNTLGVSKNNLTKVSVRFQQDGEGELKMENTFENSYEYDGDYPVLQKSTKNATVFRYEYVK